MQGEPWELHAVLCKMHQLDIHGRPLLAVIFKLRPPFFKKEINIKKKSKMTSKLDENEK